jgi:type IV pilus assembly protein PilW
LVELMIALAIGLFLVIGLISLLVSTSQTRTELDKTSRQIENGRYALQLLSADVQHAGFLGAYSPSIATFTSPPPDPCATAVANLGFDNTPTAPKLPVFIYGYDGPTADATPPSCVPAATPAHRVAGTGILVVRRVSTTAVAAAVAGETYLQVASCVPITTPFVVSATAGDFTLQPKSCVGTAALNKYIVRVYYVSECNEVFTAGPDVGKCDPLVPTVDRPWVPTLKMVEYVGGAMTITPLVEGIQNIQFDYGIDMNNDGTPDCYISNPTAPAAAQIDVAVCPQPATPYVWTDATTNWSNVVGVRIHVLARNNEASADWIDTRTYDLGLAGSYTPAAGDKFKRHVYSALARVTNVAGRRETP